MKTFYNLRAWRPSYSVESDCLSNFGSASREKHFNESILKSTHSLEMIGRSMIFSSF